MLVKIKLLLTPAQASKLKLANKKGVSTSVRLSHDQLFNEQGIDVELTPEQFKKAMSAFKSKAKRGCTLEFSPAQSGGFLPLLLGTLAGPLISGIVNATQGKSFFGDGMRPLGSGLVKTPRVKKQKAGFLPPNALDMFNNLISGKNIITGRGAGAGMAPLGSGMAPLGTRSMSGRGRKKKV
jgi:hypothetical protein